MGADLDPLHDDFRHRPLDDAGPFTFVTADALTMNAREGRRVINTVVSLATGVNNDGHREVLGLRVATSETGSARNEFFADLVARGPSSALLITSEAHRSVRSDQREPARRELATMPHSRRRELVGIFPNRDAIVHLVGAILAEQIDERAEGRRYLGLDVLARSHAAILTDPPTEPGHEPMPALTA